ncbi:MAG: hypothetical protein GTO53_14650 [Planctomycetales bacterium]|nr:hypothetical protein [Planctomycetales bacterium]NIM10322.1 hypothetical protein [Planctomycetales bacterium]NIN09769.1 hypothetical protein [Planctomycetales bacterium]NIN78892.1 hypothetical protein [Planctomycetales bacterium]NIO36063.1 hypothetical protein [Planctomycetales bacterium]
MKIQIVLAATLILGLVGSANLVCADEDEHMSLEARIAALEKQLSEIETQLLKLDFIAVELAKLSGTQPPEAAATAQAMLDGQTSPAARQTAGREVELPFLPGEADEDTASEPTDDEELLSLFGEDDQSDLSEADTPQTKTAQPLAAEDRSSAGSPQQRVARIEQVATNIQTRLNMLDDIAERLDTLARQSPTADPLRTAAKPAIPLTDQAATADSQASSGVLVVNNWTGVVHWITVNGARVQINPGRNRVPADYGVVTTQVGEQEIRWEPANWQKVGDQYELVLDLKP